MFLTERQLRLLFKAVLYESDKIEKDTKIVFKPQRPIDEDLFFSGEFFKIQDAEDLISKMDAALQDGSTGFGQQAETVIKDVLSNIDGHEPLGSLNAAESESLGRKNFNFADLVSKVGDSDKLSMSFDDGTLTVSNVFFTVKATTTNKNPFTAVPIKPDPLLNSRSSLGMCEQIIEAWVKENDEDHRKVKRLRLKLGGIGLGLYKYDKKNRKALYTITDTETEYIDSVLNDSRVVVYFCNPSYHNAVYFRSSRAIEIENLLPGLGDANTLRKDSDIETEKFYLEGIKSLLEILQDKLFKVIDSVDHVSILSLLELAQNSQSQGEIIDPILYSYRQKEEVYSPNTDSAGKIISFAPTKDDDTNPLGLAIKAYNEKRGDMFDVIARGDPKGSKGYSLKLFSYNDTRKKLMGNNDEQYKEYFVKYFSNPKNSKDLQKCINNFRQKTIESDSQYIGLNDLKNQAGNEYNSTVEESKQTKEQLKLNREKKKVLKNEFKESNIYTKFAELKKKKDKSVGKFRTKTALLNHLQENSEEYQMLEEEEVALTKSIENLQTRLDNDLIKNLQDAMDNLNSKKEELVESFNAERNSLIDFMTKIELVENEIESAQREEDKVEYNKKTLERSDLIADSQQIVQKLIDDLQSLELKTPKIKPAEDFDAEISSLTKTIRKIDDVINNLQESNQTSVFASRTILDRIFSTLISNYPDIYKNEKIKDYVKDIDISVFNVSEEDDYSQQQISGQIFAADEDGNVIYPHKGQAGSTKHFKNLYKTGHELIHLLCPGVKPPDIYLQRLINSNNMVVKTEVIKKIRGGEAIEETIKDAKAILKGYYKSIQENQKYSDLSDEINQLLDRADNGSVLYLVLIKIKQSISQFALIDRATYEIMDAFIKIDNIDSVTNLDPAKITQITALLTSQIAVKKIDPDLGNTEELISKINNIIGENVFLERQIMAPGFRSGFELAASNFIDLIIRLRFEATDKLLELAYSKIEGAEVEDIDVVGFENESKNIISNYQKDHNLIIEKFKLIMTTDIARLKDEEEEEKEEEKEKDPADQEEEKVLATETKDYAGILAKLLYKSTK